MYLRDCLDIEYAIEGIALGLCVQLMVRFTCMVAVYSFSSVCLYMIAWRIV